MFSSDDSLFEEMTKQLEGNTARPIPDITSPRKSQTTAKMTTRTSQQDQETLPDIVCTSNRTDAVTGLLMLGVDPKDVDAEIDNELVMPVNKPTQSNQDNHEKNSNKNA